MPIVQQNSGTFTGTTFTASLPAASSAANCVVLVVAGNTTLTTPTNWTLRTSQVNAMGHYLYDRAAVSLTSVAVTNSSGQGTWWIAEVAGGSYNTALSANDNTAASSYFTPNLTPAAGNKLLIASLGSVRAGTTDTIRTLSGWTNGFVEQVDVCYNGADYPMQGVATLETVVSGSTAYSTTGTYSSSVVGRSAIIGSYVTTAAAAPAFPPELVMAPIRR